MQALFALQQARMANYNQAHEYFREVFAPDLNSMEVQDSVKLQQQIAQSIALFDQHYTLEKVNLSDPDTKVENTVKQALIDFHKQNHKDRTTHLSQMLNYAEQVIVHFAHVLSFPNQVSNYIDERNETKSNLPGISVEFGTENPMVNNIVCQIINKSDALSRVWIKQGFEWDRDIVKKIWMDFVEKSESYKDYIHNKQRDLEADKKFISDMLKECVFKNEVMLNYLEENSMMWGEDKDSIKSLVLKSIKNITASTTTIELPEISSNWEDDKDFFVQLYNITLDREKEIEEVIAQKLKNWDMERVALTDKVILQMAMAEFLGFPSIPTKVTINEYIEICKEYSTPKSKQFVNGLLDAIAIEMSNNGKIKKSGRGLLDNKS
jgi:N utilization substance protein B